jgi:Holliday junction resolvase RusA-like endonuclease
MNKLFLLIPGRPAPQGSKKAFVVRGRVNLVEQSKGLPAYRKAIADECLLRSDNWNRSEVEAIDITIRFMLRPPKKHGKYPITRPDVDKLCRSVLDGVTQSGVIWKDDSQVVSIKATKTYSNEERTEIEITKWENAEQY